MQTARPEQRPEIAHQRRRRRHLRSDWSSSGHDPVAAPSAGVHLRGAGMPASTCLSALTPSMVALPGRQADRRPDRLGCVGHTSGTARSCTISERRSSRTDTLARSTTHRVVGDLRTVHRICLREEQDLDAAGQIFHRAEAQGNPFLFTRRLTAVRMPPT